MQLVKILRKIGLFTHLYVLFISDESFSIKQLLLDGKMGLGARESQTCNNNFIFSWEIFSIKKKKQRLALSIVVSEMVLSPKDCRPGTCKCDLIWKRGFADPIELRIWR